MTIAMCTCSYVCMSTQKVELGPVPNAIWPFVESWVQFQMLSGRLWRAGSSSKCYLAVCGELGPVPNAIRPPGTVQHAIHSVSHTFLQCYL